MCHHKSKGHLKGLLYTYERVCLCMCVDNLFSSPYVLIQADCVSWTGVNLLSGNHSSLVLSMYKLICYDSINHDSDFKKWFKS